MSFLAGLLRIVEKFNTTVLSIGRAIGWVAMLFMVVIILAQVFFRYALNNALPWPEEAARALMIWMMALVAPSAYRWSGFVAIDMVPDMMPPRPRAILNLFILALSMLVLIIMLGHAWTHFSSPILFNSSGLNRLLQDSGINQALGTSLEFRTSYIYFAMSVCLCLMITVGIELITRALCRLSTGSDEDFPAPHMPVGMAPE